MPPGTFVSLPKSAATQFSARCVPHQKQNTTSGENVLCSIFRSMETPLILKEHNLYVSRETHLLFCPRQEVMKPRGGKRQGVAGAALYDPKCTTTYADGREGRREGLDEVLFFLSGFDLAYSVYDLLRSTSDE